MGWTNHQRVTDRILDVVAHYPECTIEDVMRLYREVRHGALADRVETQMMQ